MARINKMFYPGLSNSLRYLRVQVVDSLPYVAKNIPRFNSLQEIFKYCKSDFTYKNDPELEELFQTVGTLLENNFHGYSGHGDCDDATIYCLAVMLLSGFECGIVLAGRTQNRATHIYAYGVENGQKKILDLTTSEFNKEGGSKNYNFRQYIPFKISKNQLDMFLTLADGVSIPTSKRKLRIRHPRKKEAKVYLPTQGVTIPAQRLDKMPIATAKNVMLNDGCSVDQLSDYLSGRKERKAKRADKRAYKKEKKQIKLEKKRANVEKKQSRSEVRRAKADKKRATGEAKILRGEAKKIKGAQPRRDFSGAFNTIGNVASKFINRGGGEEEDFAQEVDYEEVPGGSEYSGSEEVEQYGAEEIPAEEIEAEENFDLQDGFTTYKPVIFGLGILLAGALIERGKIV